jgi:hypothetical protein
MGNDSNREVLATISRWLLASVMFFVIAFGWLGDCLVSAVIRRPPLSFQEVYASWKDHLRTRYFQPMNH